MATSFLQWNKSSSSMENNSSGGENLKVEHTGCYEENKEKKQRGRKSIKASQKKQPQRGLGVARLERLRLQERWKKMTQFDHVQAAQNILARPCGPLSLSYQSGFEILNSSQKLGNQLFMADDKDLSSTQGSIHCVSEYCDYFQKKRTLVLGDNVGFYDGANMRGCDFLGLSLGRKRPIIDGGNCSSNGLKLVDEDVEVVGVHRKGEINGRVLMEYEFFPARKGSSSTGNNKDYSSSSMSVVAEEGTERSVSGASTTNTEWLDLSLRLSC